MNSTLKYLLPLAALVVVIFVATLISQNVGDHQTDPLNSGEPVLKGPPLYFAYDMIGYDPLSEDIVLRHFRAFYEPGGPKVLIPYWFKNPHPVPVRVVVVGRSCTSCSTVRLATISDDNLNRFGSHIAAGTLPVSPIGPPSLLTGLSALVLMDSAHKQDFDLDHRPDLSLEVPAAKDPNTPTWGMLILGVDVSGIGAKQLRADLSFQAGNMAPVAKPLLLTVFGVPPFEIVPKQVRFDDMPEGAEPQTKDLFYWSATRSLPVPGRDNWPSLTPPKLSLSGTDPFLTVGQAVPLDESDYFRIPTGQPQGAPPPRILGAYRIPITLSRKAPGPQPGTTIEPDIGPYDRTIGITAEGTLVAQQVKIQSTMTGLVSLRGSASAVDLASFKGDSGTRVRGALVAEQKDVKLESVAAEAKPTYLNVKLLPPETQGGRTYWPFEVEVKPGACSGELPPDSVIVFQATTPTGVRKIRVPVKGRAFAR